MKLLSRVEIKKTLQETRDKEFLKTIEMRNVLIKEIKQFNKEKEEIIRAKQLIEEDFKLYCDEIHEKRRELQKEIKLLEAKKKSLENN